MAAWWVAAVFIVVGCVSTITTFMNVGLMHLYEKMNYSQQQLDITRQYNNIQGPDMVISVGIFMVVFLAYLMYTRKFFYRKG